MRDRRDDSTLPPSGSSSGRSSVQPPNAFDSEFLDALSRREPAPATPEADFAGPWRVTRLHGEGPELWACVAAGEREPRLTFQEPDLAYLAAAALEITERPERFRLQKGADGRVHLMHDGYPAATAAPPIAPGCNLPEDLTRLADLRVRPQALAHFLLSVPDEVLRRTGVLLAQAAREGGR